MPGATNGGPDKGTDGHRIDSIPIANGVIKAGCVCDVIKYSAEKHDEFAASIDKYHGFIVRIEAGQLSSGTPEGTQEAFDALMAEQLMRGKLVWSSPEVQRKMDSKDAIVHIKQMSCGLTDTYAYHDEETFSTQFRQTMACGSRVIKQNRGSSGEGVWLCWLEGKSYATKPKPGSALEIGHKPAMLDDGDTLKLMEMSDNHVERHTVREFIEFCVRGPGGAAGEWQSRSAGAYLKHSHVVDQRLLPRISEGEVRLLLVGDSVQSIVHKKPLGKGMSAVGSKAVDTHYIPGCKEYAGVEASLRKNVPPMMTALQLEGQPLPLLWSADFIPKDAEDGAPGVTEYAVGEFNCACVGVSELQAVAGGDGALAQVADADYFEACKLTDLMGAKAVEMLARATERHDDVQPPPPSYKFRVALVEYTSRIDSVPLANGIIKAGAACDILKYVPAQHDEFGATLGGYDAVVVRIEPGQLAPEATREAFDALMAEQRRGSRVVWPSPMRPPPAEAEVRAVLVGDRLQTIIRKRSEIDGGGFATVLPGTAREYAALEETLRRGTQQRFGELMQLEGQPLPLLWTVDFAPSKKDDGTTDFALGEFNRSCVGVAQFAPSGVGAKLADVSDADYVAGCKLTDLMGRKVVQAVTELRTRHNELQPAPKQPKFKVGLVEYNTKRFGKDMHGGLDKGRDGTRPDSVPLANGIIKAGAACHILKYVPALHDEFVEKVKGYDALFNRVEPGMISLAPSADDRPAAAENEKKFNEFMDGLAAQGKVVWTAPEVQVAMGAKDALVTVREMACGLADTFAYADEETFDAQFRQTMAFQPRVIKPSASSVRGEGVWECHLEGKDYCGALGEATLDDGDTLKLVERNDGHVEKKTVKQFIEFCMRGHSGDVGMWKTTSQGSYLEEGRTLTDERLLERRDEGLVKVLMAADSVLQVTHQRLGTTGLASVPWLAPAVPGSGPEVTHFEPGSEEYAGLEANLASDLPKLLPAFKLDKHPLPLVWSLSFTAKDADDGSPTTQYAFSGEGTFSCASVGISQLQAVAGGERTLVDVPDNDFFDGRKLADAVGAKAVEMLARR